jgi:sulfite reductase (NADPH) hemoprotein beta-component
MNDLSTPIDQLHPNERLKHGSDHLRGTLVESLADAATGAVDDDDALLTKFFGIYQQDDRDLREERRRARLEPRYQFMVRVRLPGGACTPRQWLALDDLARRFGREQLRMTTRQTFQFHGVAKRHLRPLLQGMRDAGLDTVAACGDDNRNVIATANPLFSPAHAEAGRLAREISAALMPRTGAYREVFLGEPRAVPPGQEEEPIYGSTYLPRKFKIAIAVPPRNDIDVFAHDLGFIAIVEGGRIVGYDVTVGGGMGMTHRVPATFPRLGDVIGFCLPEDVQAVALHTMCIQRDFGDRRDRAHARFKYTIEDRGTGWFLAELARRLGKPLEPARAFAFETSGDPWGWRQGADGLWHYTLNVGNGRLRDFAGRRLLTGLREVARVHRGLFALTTNQNVTIAGVSEDRRAEIDAVLREQGIANAQATPVRRSAIACVALPTCALAMAESERYMPVFLDRVEALMAEAGVADARIHLRISGCPNGCSRPYLGEIALVGRAPGRYNLYLGASHDGTRLNALHLDNADEDAILAALRAALHRYAAERREGEGFGDFVVRAGIVPAMRHGRDFQRLPAERAA